MPVFEDDEAKPTPAQNEPTIIASPSELMRVTDQSTACTVTVCIERDASIRGAVANRAAAEALLVRHEWVYQQDRARGATDVAREWTPEQKLLRAIFGEKAGTVAVKGLDDRGVPEEGATIVRGDPVLCDPLSRAELRFIEEEEGTIARVEIETEGLPEALRERAIVTVVREQPLCVGDAVLHEGRELAVVTAIIDDGREEPALRVASDCAIVAVSAKVSRPTKTARQQLVARNIGPYDPRTEQPVGADAIAFDAIAALVDRGCMALFTDFAAHKFDGRAMRSALQESMMQGKAIQAPFTVEATTPAPASDAGIFDFFSRPKANSPSGSALLRATAYARAMGVELRYESTHALALGLREDATVDSAGEASTDLSDPRLFGPRRSYECECGALKLMKNRGTTCTKCGVTVLDASVRATTFAHVTLREPWMHPLLGAKVSVVSVLPPRLRESTDPELEAAYQSLVSERAASAAQRVFDLLLDRLCEALRPPERVVLDYSCAALCVVDESIEPEALIAPLDGVATMCAPLLCGKLEELGYATTIMSARSMIRSDEKLRRASGEWALRTRPLLVATERSAFVAVEAAGVTTDPVFRVGVGLAARLGVRTGDRVNAHLPLSESAIREASWLVTGGDRDVLRAHERGERSWIVALADAPVGERLARLREAVESRAVDCCADARGVGAGRLRARRGRAARARMGAVRSAELRRRSWQRIERHSLGARSLGGRARAVRSQASALQSMGIRTIRELVQKSEVDMLESKNFGLKSLIELKELLAEMGLSFGMRLS